MRPRHEPGVPIMRGRLAGEEHSVRPPTTHLCCLRCRVRFTPAAAASISACPECGDPPELIASLERTFGFRLLGPDDLPHELPYATAVSIALPRPGAPTKPDVD
jgi:hypothetical protein